MKHSNHAKVQMVVRVSPDLKNRLRIMTIEHDCTLEYLVENCLRDYIKDLPGKRIVSIPPDLHTRSVRASRLLNRSLESLMQQAVGRYLCEIEPALTEVE